MIMGRVMIVEFNESKKRGMTVNEMMLVVILFVSIITLVLPSVSIGTPSGY